MGFRDIFTDIFRFEVVVAAVVFAIGVAALLLSRKKSSAAPAPIPRSRAATRLCSQPWLAASW
ncbi:MAG: hypothetical protein GEU97_01270 [Actinophytocola sp.]|nr:hypothetical protein [Actinophytocola sp.]